MSSINLVNETLKATPTQGEIEFNGQFHATDNNSSRAQMQRLVLETSKTASGTSVNFTGIPAWVKRITLQINGLSYAAANAVGVVRLGTGAVLTSSGYSGSYVNFSTTPNITTTTSTDGFGGVNAVNATDTLIGTCVITNITGNTWVCVGSVFRTGANLVTSNYGSIALSGVLDSLSIVATTGTFDAGTINILYEG